VSADLNTTQIAPGESVDVSATVENTGDGAGSTEVRLFVDGEYAGESRVVQLGPGEQTTVVFTEEFTTPGEYEIAVENTTAGTLTVGQPSPTPTVTESPTPGGPGESPTPPTPSVTEDGGGTPSVSPGGPGGGLGTTVVIVVVILLLVGVVAAVAYLYYIGALDQFFG
jgi:hypothetical protein